MTNETNETNDNLNAVSRDISPSTLQRDDALLNQMADAVSYASDAHRTLEALLAWYVKGHADNGSQYVFVSVPGDVWTKVEAFANRKRPELLDQADEYLRRYQP